MKIKKLYLATLTLLMVLMLVMTTTVSVYAYSNYESNVKTVKTYEKMSLILDSQNPKGDSNSIQFKVSGLPKNAIITKLEINTGDLSANGVIRNNYLEISGNGRSERIPWTGQANKTLATNNFLMADANGTYTVSFNGTFVSGTIKNGRILDIATKTYSNLKLIIYWDTME